MNEELKGDILKLLINIQVRIAFNGHPKEPMNKAGPDWSKEIREIEKVKRLLT